MVFNLSILLPLYIYPTGCSVKGSSCAWQPLYDALNSYPSLPFVVVVNPNSGPGDAGSMPDTEYAAAISTINSYPNVKTIGYIHSSYGGRAIGDLQSEVDTYAGWASNNGLKMHGIFVDEAAQDESMIDYYSGLSSYIHGKFTADNTFVIANPGTTISQAWFDAMPQDNFVTFEAPESHQWDEYTIFTDSRYASTPRARQGIIVNQWTVTADDTTNLVNFTDTMGEIEKFPYIHVATAGDYNSFPSNWAPFVSAVNGTNWYMAQHPEWFSRS